MSGCKAINKAANDPGGWQRLAGGRGFAHVPLSTWSFRLQSPDARGFTLIELVMAIVILAAALSGVLLVINQNTAKSGDPVITTQAQAVAQSYLEEIMLQAYSDPDGSDAGESRATYDDVDDYDGLTDNGARDQFGSAITSLADYTVSVSVAVTTLGATAAKLVTVTAGRSGNTKSNVTLSAYRTNF